MRKPGRHVTDGLNALPFQTQHANGYRRDDNGHERCRNPAKQPWRGQQDQKCAQTHGERRPMRKPELLNEFRQSRYDSSHRYGITKDLANLTENDA